MDAEGLRFNCQVRVDVSPGSLFQRGIAASPLASDRWIVVVAIGDILSNRSRGVLPRKFNALWPKPECEMETGRVPEARSIAAIPVPWTFMSEILAMRRT